MMSKRDMKDHDQSRASDDLNMEETLEARISQLFHEETKDVHFTRSMRERLMQQLPPQSRMQYTSPLCNNRTSISDLKI